MVVTMGDEEPHPRQGDFEEVPLGSGSGSPVSSTGDEFISDVASTSTSVDNEAPGVLELSSESLPSVDDVSSPPRASAPTMEPYVSLGPRLPAILVPSGPLSGFMGVDSAPLDTAHKSDSDDTLSASSAIDTSSVAGANAPRDVALPAPVAPPVALGNNPPAAEPSHANGVANGNAMTNGSDSDYSNLSDFTVTPSGTDDETQPRRDSLDLLRVMLMGNPVDSNRLAEEAGAQGGDVLPSSSGSLDLAGIGQHNLQEDTLSSTLSSMSSLTISEAASISADTSLSGDVASSSGGTAVSSANPGTPKRRTTLVYKPVLDNHYLQLAQVLDPHVLSKGDPASRLEEECLCDGCLAEMDDKVSKCLNLLFKVFRTECPLCKQDDRMKEYQSCCYYCSRTLNLCFHCGNQPVVVDVANLLDFESLFSETDKVFFATLIEQQRRHIAYEIFREWDAAPRDIALEKVKGMLKAVLNNMRECGNMFSVNPPI